MKRGIFALTLLVVAVLAGSAAANPRAKAKPAVKRTAEAPAKPRRKRLKPLNGVEGWPTYGYDEARSRVAPGYKLRPPFRQVWQFRARHYIEFPPGVADARSGRELWRFNAGAIESTPLLRGETLYFGSWDHHLYAVDIRGGRLRWAYRADDEVNTAPAYAGGTIFVGTDGGRVHGVWARNGRMRWRNSSFARFGRREYFYATPTVAYGRVFIGNTDGTMYAYGASSGRLLWASRAGS